jgi:DNA-binding CsgD family transcriptional regulator
MWKESDIDKIIARLKRRESVEKVARTFNVNKGSIYALIHSRGYDLYCLKHQLPTPEDKIRQYEMLQDVKMEKRKLRLKRIQERREKMIATKQKQKTDRAARLMRLADMWRQGMTCREIGVEEGGLTRSRISQLLYNYNKEFPETPLQLNKRRQGKNIKKTKMLSHGKAAFEYRQKGKNFNEIAKTLEISPAMVKSALKHYCSQNKLTEPGQTTPRKKSVKAKRKISKK